MKNNEFAIIGHIITPYREKFGIPRQSGMVNNTLSKIVFEPKYRNSDALRGLSDFSHIWVIWKFSGFESDEWSPTVRPPRLGGNTRMGVFATRSPNRPNPIGLSSLKLVKIDFDDKEGPVLYVLGADMVSGTEIFDIKPYIPFTDSHPDAKFGFAEDNINYKLKVNFTRKIATKMTDSEFESAIEILSLDPRPSYHNAPDRIYGVSLFNYNIKFKVVEDELTVVEVE